MFYPSENTGTVNIFHEPHAISSPCIIIIHAYLISLAAHTYAGRRWIAPSGLVMVLDAFCVFSAVQSVPIIAPVSNFGADYPRHAVRSVAMLWSIRLIAVPKYVGVNIRNGENCCTQKYCDGDARPHRLSKATPNLYPPLARKSLLYCSRFSIQPVLLRRLIGVSRLLSTHNNAESLSTTMFM